MQVRFPTSNRRTDSGVGEISLVTGPELKIATSLSGFQTGASSDSGNQGSFGSGNQGLSYGSGSSSYGSDRYPNGLQSDISSRVDVTSNEEFVVGTTLSLSGGKLENEMLNNKQNNYNKGKGRHRGGPLGTP